MTGSCSFRGEDCRQRGPKWLKWETYSPVTPEWLIKGVLSGHALVFRLKDFLPWIHLNWLPIKTLYVFASCSTTLQSHARFGNLLFDNYSIYSVILPKRPCHYNSIFCSRRLLWLVPPVCSSYFELLNLGQIFIHFSLALVVDCMLGNYRKANLLCQKIFLRRKDPLCSQETAFFNGLR